jgi:hypothetical protein
VLRRMDPDPLVPVQGTDPDPVPVPDPSVITNIVRKTLIPTVLWRLYDFFIFEKDVNVAS